MFNWQGRYFKIYRTKWDPYLSVDDPRTATYVYRCCGFVSNKCLFLSSGDEWRVCSLIAYFVSEHLGQHIWDSAQGSKIFARIHFVYLLNRVCARNFHSSRFVFVVCKLIIPLRLRETRQLRSHRDWRRTMFTLRHDLHHLRMPR